MATSAAGGVRENDLRWGTGGSSGKQEPLSQASGPRAGARLPAGASEAGTAGMSQLPTADA